MVLFGKEIGEPSTRLSNFSQTQPTYKMKFYSAILQEGIILYK